MSELNKIALQILSNGKGILAADESTATMTKRLDSVKVHSDENNRLLFRQTLFSSLSMKECIGGVILYDETIRQKTSNWKFFVLLFRRIVLLHLCILSLIKMKKEFV